MKIAWLSDFDVGGSGYLNISIPLCDGLAALGHDVKAIGLGYRGQEHYFNFSIVPIENLVQVVALLHNMHVVWKPDVLVVALDIPHQDHLLKYARSENLELPPAYIGIMPIESDPLCLSWAMVLMQMKKQLIISQFGTNEAHKAGVSTAEYFPIGIDTRAWMPPTDEIKKRARQALGIGEDEFVVLTVAANQERKNLSGSMFAFKYFAQGKKARYLMVTQTDNIVGWKLRDFAQEIEINDKLMLFERGLVFNELYMIYSAADAFLLLSKAEGLGMPLLEAMAMKIPCIVTNCTAMGELVADGRGFPVRYDYSYRDPFGNGFRYFANSTHAAEHLQNIYENGADEVTNAALEYIQTRDWGISIEQLDRALKAAVQ